MTVYVSGFIQGVEEDSIQALTSGFMVCIGMSKDGENWDVTYLSETPMYAGQMPFSGCYEGLDNV